MSKLRSLCRSTRLVAVAAVLAVPVVASLKPGGAVLAQADPPEAGPSQEPPRTPPREAGPRNLELKPRPGVRPGRLEAGEVLLVVVLQTLSDSSGKRVVWTSERALAEETIHLAREIPQPVRESLERALASAGYAVSEEEVRGEKVLLVVRELRPTRRKGTFTRPGEAPPEREPGRKVEIPRVGKGREAAPAAPAAQGAPRLFRRSLDGRDTFLLLFETTSASEAQEALDVLRSFLESRKTGRSDTPPSRPAQEK